jgi:hypothetical protein
MDRFLRRLLKPEPSSAKTITRPSVVPVSIAPNQYPSINRDGRGSSSITVVAATRVGLTAATNASPTILPIGESGARMGIEPG